jgi:hypothetical protein
MPLLAAAVVVVAAAAWERRPRAAACAAIAFLPAMAVLLVYVRTQRSPAYVRFPLPQLVSDLARVDVLLTFVRTELALAAALGALVAALALRGLWQRRAGSGSAGDAFLLLAILFAAVYLFAPAGAFGGAYLTPRLMVFPVFGALLWLASLDWTPLMRRSATAAGGILAVGLVAVRLPSYAALDAEMTEFATAESWLRPGDVVLPLQFAGPDEAGYPRVRAMAHAAAYPAAARRALELTFYEGNKRGQFALEFPLALDPYRMLEGNPETVPPCVDLAGFTRRTGRVIDVVLTWRQTEHDAFAECSARVLREIRDGYDLAYTSPGTRRLKVWRRKG